MTVFQYKHVMVTDGYNANAIPWHEFTDLPAEDWEIHWSDQSDGLFHFILVREKSD